MSAGGGIRTMLLTAQGAGEPELDHMASGGIDPMDDESLAERIQSRYGFAHHEALELVAQFGEYL